MKYAPRHSASVRAWTASAKEAACTLLGLLFAALGLLVIISVIVDRLIETR